MAVTVLQLRDREWIYNSPVSMLIFTVQNIHVKQLYHSMTTRVGTPHTHDDDLMNTAAAGGHMVHGGQGFKGGGVQRATGIHSQ